MEKAKKENLINVIMVVSSNIFTILVALFSGFILPKELSIPDYAYYRVYLLYISYAGFFHFGIVNGIYLKYGNMDLEQIPKKVFRAYSFFMLLSQAAVAAVLSLLLFGGASAMEQDKVIAFGFVIINIPLINIKWFYSSINQFTKRFVIDSFVTYLQNILNLVMVLLVILFRWYDFKWILVILTICNLVCMVIVMGQNKILLWGEKARLGDTGIPELIKNGFFLMLSEFVGIIILGIDSMFVDNLFSQTEFAMYSFAVSVISVIFTAISAVSNLVYPYLVRVEEEKYAEYYGLMSDVLSMVSMVSMLAFYAAEFIILRWLEKFIPSLSVVAILFGTVVFRAVITLVCGNYFKVLKLIKEYTWNNIFAIGISFLLNAAAYVMFRDYRYIAGASLLSFVIWYLVTERIFIRYLQIPLAGCLRRYGYILAGLLIFYLLADADPIPGFFLYFAAVCGLSLLCFWRQLQNLLGIVKGNAAG